MTVSELIEALKTLPTSARDATVTTEMFDIDLVVIEVVYERGEVRLINEQSDDYN